MFKLSAEDQAKMDRWLFNLRQYPRLHKVTTQMYDKFRLSPTEFKLTINDTPSIASDWLSVLILDFHHKKTDISVRFTCFLEVVGENIKPRFSIESNKYGIASSVVTDKEFDGKASFLLDHSLVDYLRHTSVHKVTRLVDYLATKYPKQDRVLDNVGTRIFLKT